ncbi:MAG: hypothetical protein AAF710_07340 [Planctomycetota bacterium]
MKPALLLVLATALLTGCNAPVRVSTLDSHGRPDLTPHYDHRPIDLVRGGLLAEPGDAELIDSLRDARRAEGLLPGVAAERYLDVAERAYRQIADPETPDDRRTLLTQEVYNRAVAGYVRVAPPNEDDDRVTRIATFDPADFDTYTPAADLRIVGLGTHHVTPGFGAPLIAARDTDPDEPADAHYPPEGVTRPLTATLVFPPAPALPRLTLHDPRQVRDVAAGDISLPLAADFSAPYAALLAETADLAALGFAAMLTPAAGEDRLNVYLLEPYDPDKTPLLMVHGLMSTPLAWIELTNEVQSDPTLRDRYQVWHFYYPTGSCPYYSAFYLRERLDALRLRLDPELDDPATQDVVVVGHSMGGLLTRTLVTDPGLDAWHIAFTVPPDQLEGDPETVDFLAGVYIFEPRDYVRRVVFVATPHRGSDFANNLIGTFGRSLVRLPRVCHDKTVAVARANRDRLQPGYGPWLLNGPPSSIDILRPESPASAAVDFIPIADGVDYHSIIGTRVDLADGDPEGSSDGIVAYWSSRLDGATSELLVPAGHNAHDHPDAIAEVKRILHEHHGETRVSGVAGITR